jgi:23S rRNA (cytidine1920-2'-O)/16S rRNA (cytidine1409-2'-O)-methyltransferase
MSPTVCARRGSSMAKGERLDVRMVALGLAPSRANAQALILANMVLINGRAAGKASTAVSPEDVITIKQRPPYVSRGGLKLEKALSSFSIDVGGLVCLDVGASTGGFTDCLLQHGAGRVYAVDVGHGQLDYALRQHERVVVLERYNARNLRVEDIEPVGFACADVSFISLRHILAPIRACLLPGANAVVLIKPQFEAGRALIHRGGVVRDPKVRAAVIEVIMQFAQSTGYCVRGVEPSPIHGPKGNEEYLLWLGIEGEPLSDEDLRINARRAAGVLGENIHT